MSVGIRWWLSVGLSLLALVGLRLVHLEADTPAWMGSGPMAVFVDEGYKTLGARNLVLFGDTHWNSQDTYPTWMKKSPLTQWLFAGSFSSLGARVESARLVTVVFFAVFLTGFAAAMRRRSGTLCIVAGLALLGLNHVVFFFSRLAMFELPMIVVLFGALFEIRRREGADVGRTLPLVLALFLIASLGIKPSAVVYFLPVVVALVVYIGRRQADSIGWLRLLVLAGLVVGVVLFLTRVYWMSHLALRPDMIRSALLNPTLKSSGLLVAACLICISHWVACEPKLIREDPYRLSLVSLVAIGPTLLALGATHPLRYYVPFLPAFALVVWEWFRLGSWKLPNPGKLSGLRLAMFLIVVFWSVLCLEQWLDQVFQIWTGTTIRLPVVVRVIDFSRLPRLLVAAVLAGAMSLLAWRLRGWLFRGRVVAGIVLVLVCASWVRDAAAIGRFFHSPSYRSRQIAADLAEIIREDESMAGDWAPFFALGTPIRALYLTSRTNPPSRIAILRPTYFLFCDSPTGDARAVRHDLEQATDVQLGPAVFRSEYIGLEVILYRLAYPPAGDT